MSLLGQTRSQRVAADESEGWVETGSSSWIKFRNWVKSINVWLWLIVFIPSLLSGVYLFGIASDQYLAEGKFLVRSDSKNSAGAISAILQSTGLSRAQDDIYSITDFLQSRDVVRSLEKNQHLREMLNRPEGDFLTHFPNALSGPSFEAMYKHFEDFLEVDYDTQTGVTTLDVRTYRPEDSQTIADAMLGYSEALVNRMNMRAETDGLASARHEVDLAEQRIEELQGKLMDYRVQAQILDPKSESLGVLQNQTDINTQKIQAETKLAELLKQSPGNPEVEVLRARVAALKDQSAETQAKLAGTNNSVVSKMRHYDQLDLEETLAEKELESAETSMQLARMDVQRQQLYVERIVEPAIADYPLYPRRLIDFIVIVGSCFLVYGIGWLLVAGVREHASA